MTEAPPKDRSTFERDYRETRNMKRILGVVLFVAIIAFAFCRASLGH